MGSSGSSMERLSILGVRLCLEQRFCDGDTELSLETVAGRASRVRTGGFGDGWRVRRGALRAGLTAGVNTAAVIVMSISVLRRWFQRAASAVPSPIAMLSSGNQVQNERE